MTLLSDSTKKLSHLGSSLAITFPDEEPIPVVPPGRESVTRSVTALEILCVISSDYAHPSIALRSIAAGVAHEFRTVQRAHVSRRSAAYATHDHVLADARVTHGREDDVERDVRRISSARVPHDDVAD